MSRSIRSLIAAAALVAAGGLIGPQLGVSAQSGDTPVASESADGISTGPETVFIPISSYRAYDSRTDSFAGKIDSAQAGDPGRNQRPVYAGWNTETDTDMFDLIADEVVAVTYNVQAVQTEGRGFMHVDGFFGADGSSSTLVWDSTGQRVSNSGVALLTSAFDDPGFLGVYVGGLGGKSHVIIDITGWYVRAA